MISLKDISLQYGEFKLFSDLSLTIKNGDKMALVGRNGAGKSTLFRVILGHVVSDTGIIDIPKGETVGVLEQDIKLDQVKTARETVMEAFPDIVETQKDIDRITLLLETETDDDKLQDLSVLISDAFEKLNHHSPEKLMADLEKVMKGLGFTNEQLDWPVGHFSGGWQMRLLLARLLLLKPDFLLLDEPTNHLDIVSIIWLEKYLMEYNGSFVVISHDKRFMDGVAKKVVEIENRNVQIYNGNYSKYEVEKVERRAVLESAFENQQKEIERKEKLIDKFRAKASKASMAQSLMGELKRMDKIEIEASDSTKINMVFPDAPRSAERVVTAKNLTKHYGDNHVIQNLDFDILRAQRVSLIGQNGQGKTTLVKMLTGVLPQTSGSYEIGTQVIMKYFAQDEGEQLDGKLTVLEWMIEQSDEKTRTKVRSVLGAFMFSQEDVDKKISVLSGGERSRLALAGMMLSPMNFLIMDEPTNHLDLNSKEILKNALLKYEGALLIISHDRDFLEDLTDNTYVLHNGQMKHHLGDVTSFLSKEGFDSLESFTLSNSQNPKIDIPIVQEVVDKEIDKKQQRKLQYLERDIERLEESKTKIEADMGKDDFYGSERYDSVLVEYEDVKGKIVEKMSEWEKMVEETEG